VRAGDDLAALIVDATARQEFAIRDGDILVVTQKVVSKAEGRVVRLADVQPSPLALAWGQAYGRDPRHVEVILRESKRIIRMERGIIVSETRHGFKCANAGVDASNLPGEGTVSLLPDDPDASAERVRSGVRARLGVDVAVIVSDTFGRPWREGAVNVAVGVAGLSPLKDYRGGVESHGRPLRTTVVAVADELAAAAELAMNKVTRVPVALIRGYDYQRAAQATARALIRPPEQDLFP
jgi:coenzyme F420-0:L-glutamate ligase/coenzyme F420-1:gamma-L-glutamate ligase